MNEIVMVKAKKLNWLEMRRRMYEGLYPPVNISANPQPELPIEDIYVVYEEGLHGGNR